MKKVRIRCEAELNKPMNIVSCTGTIVNSNSNYLKLELRILLMNALQWVHLAEANGALFIPKDELPVKKDEQFVYMEVMFKTKTDCEIFWNAINKLYS